MGKKAIKGAPRKKVSNLSTPTRDGYKFATKWKVPSDRVSEKYEYRFEGLSVQWHRYTEETKYNEKKAAVVKTKDGWKWKKNGRKKGKIISVVKNPKQKKQVTVTTTKESKVKKALETDKKSSTSTTSDTITIKKSKYYPYTKEKFGGIEVSVAGTNHKGKSKKTLIGPYLHSKKLELERPNPPLIQNLSLDLDTGELTATAVMRDAEKNPCCGMRCWIDVTHYNGKNKKTESKKATWPSGKWVDTGKSNFNCQTGNTNMRIDITDWQTFAYSGDHNGYIQVDFYAQSFGMAGVSGKAHDYFIFAFPDRPVIKETETLNSVKASNVYSSKGANTLTVYFSTGDSGKKNDKRPVDQVNLQLYKNADPSLTAEDVALDTDGWEDVATDDGECLGLAVGVDKALSDKGKYTWCRVRSYNDNLYLDSKPLKLTNLFRKAPTAADDKVAILKPALGADGTSIELWLGRDNNDDPDDDDATGIEVSWSESANAWKSNQPPNTFNVDWVDKSYKPTKNVFTGASIPTLSNTPANSWNTDALKTSHLGDIYYVLVDGVKPSDYYRFMKKSGSFQWVHITSANQGEDAAYLPPGQEWLKQSFFVLEGLMEGQQYYIKARAYKEGAEGEITYGAYTDANQETDEELKLVPTSSPTAISVIFDSYLAEGKDLPVSWLFSASAQQTSWTISKPPEDQPTGATGETGAVGETGSESETNDKGNEIASANDSAGATILKWDNHIQPNIVETTSESGDTVRTFSFVVSMTTGGTPITSTTCVVTVVNPPVATLTAPVTLTEKPLRYTVESTINGIEVLTRVESKGTTIEWPDRFIDQAPGDIIWAATLRDGSGAVGETGAEGATGETGAEGATGETGEEQSSSIIDVEVPADRDIFDKTDYIIYVTLHDTNTDLYSEEVSAQFSVDWQHQAAMPASTSRAIGFSSSELRGCHIYPVAPENALDTDRAEIYRVTPDGTTLIADNVIFGSTVTDRYAPFSLYVPLRYIIGTRTADGDFESREVQYNVTSATMRFDWHSDSGRSMFVELPWNNKFSDSFTKDFETRQHLNGDRMGTWNDGYGRTASLSTDTIKLTEYDKIELVKNLAEHSGSIFVRTPDGSAYEADVQVNTIDWEFNNPVRAVSLTATQITPSEEFTCTNADIVSPAVPEEPEEEPTGET